MTFKKLTTKTIIVDTEDYAGFARELVAYVTGQVGESGGGRSQAQTAVEESVHHGWWTDHVIQLEDDKGWSVPGSMHPTPGWFNNGMGKHYRDDPENYEIACQAAMVSMRETKDEYLKPVRARLEAGDFQEDRPGAWTKEACLRAIEEADKSVKAIGEAKRRWPSFQSIAIFVKEFPPEDVMAEFVARVQEFAAIADTACRLSGGRVAKITLTGVRLYDPKTGVFTNLDHQFQV